MGYDDRTPDPPRPIPDQPPTVVGGRSGSAWTTDTLKEYVERIVADQARLTEQALRASDRAIEKADAADTKKFDAVNEFRQTYADLTRTFIPRAEVEALMAGLSAKLDAAVKAMNDKQEAAAATIRSLVIALIGLALTAGVAVTIALTNLLSALQK